MFNNNCNNVVITIIMWKTSLQLNLFVSYGIYCSVYNNYGTEKETANKLINYLTDLISFYSDYDVNFHFDSTNSYLINKLIPKLDFDIISAVILINYDDECTHHNFTRSHSKEILNVVILDTPSDFVLYCNDTRNIRRRDVVLFVLYNNNLINDLVEITGLNLFGNAVFIVSDNTTVTIKKVCYFCGNLTGEIQKWQRNSFELNKTNLEARGFTDFFQHSFKIAFIDYFPLVWCEEFGEDSVKHYGRCSYVKGTEYQLISVVAQILNFKVIPFLYENDYVKLITYTGGGEFDVAMGGITVTADRYELATFTSMYWYESYNCLFFYKKDPWKDLLGFLKPLEGILWFTIIVTCMLTAATFHLIGRYEKFKNSGISCLRTFWACMQLLIDQQVPHKSISKLRRRSLFLLSAWCLVCLNMNTGYKSKVLSVLLNPPHKEPQSFLEVLDEGFSIVTNGNYHDVISSLLRYSHTSQKYKKVLSNLILINNVCKEFEYAANHKAVVIDEYTSLQYEVRSNCLHAMKKNKALLSNARITRSLNMFGHGWALQKGVPFAEVFSKVINKIVAAGLILKWRKDATRSMDQNSSYFRYTYIKEKKHENTVHVNLQMLMSPFFVYIVGNLFAIVVFIAEMIK